MKMPSRANEDRSSGRRGPPRGGPSTITGILYQILGSLGWVATIRLNPVIEGKDFAKALLVLEPRRGGDVQIRTNGHRIVEQWKLKSDQGAWSLNQVIDDVFTDLYKSIERLDEVIDYHFVTEGTGHTWQAASDFFRSLKSQPIPDDPLGALDNQQPERFFAREECTRRELFSRILGRTKQKQDDQVLAARKLWHLLANFEIRTASSFAELSAEVDEWLQEVAELREDVQDLRHRCVGSLLRLAAQGDQTFAPNEWLRSIGLRGRPFYVGGGWQILRNVLAARLEADLGNARYKQTLDVRSVQGWSEAKPVLVFSGESGTGKTWRLARLAVEKANTTALAVWCPSAGEPEKTLRSASDVIWRHGLGNDASHPLGVPANRFLEKLQSNPNPLAFVFVDNVQSVAEARGLAAQPWGAWHMRLALSAPPHVAEALKASDPEKVELVTVEAFKMRELKDYLALRGRDWERLSPDIRKVVSLPLMAQIYCDLPEDLARQPSSDLALLQRYWSRFVGKCRESDHLGDVTLLRELAITLLEEPAVYPWTGAKLKGCGIHDEVRQRLQATGWLRTSGEDGAEIWHDRLLNWAVAQAVKERCRSEPANSEALLDAVAKLAEPWRYARQRRLDDAPTDLLWLLAADTNVPAIVQTAVRFLRCLEAVFQAPFRAAPMYEKVLPSLGESLLPVVLARLESDEGQANRPGPDAFANCFAQFAKVAPDQVRGIPKRLIEDKRLEVQETGLRLLATIPDASCLDWIWSRHRTNTTAIRNHSSNQRRYIEYQQTSAALRNCVAQCPGWLETQIGNSATDPHLIDELAWLVATLPHPVGAPLWRRVKVVLLSAVSPDTRALASCIANFRDEDEFHRLIGWIKQDVNFVAPHALICLSLVAPDVALDNLRSVNPNVLWWAQSTCISELFLRRPEQTLRAFRQWLENTGVGFWKVAGAYRSIRLDVDAPTLDFLLNRLEKDLASAQTDTLSLATNTKDILELLAAFRTPAAVDAFGRRAGGELENQIKRLACEVIQEGNQHFMQFVEPALTILLSMGGSGFTEVVNAILARPGYRGYEWHRWAAVRPNTKTRELLVAISNGEALEEIGGRKLPYDQQFAIRSLAAMEENDAVVSGVLKWGEDVAWSELAEIRSYLPPMRDECLRTAISGLNSPDAKTQAHSLLAIGLSGRKEFLDTVRQIALKPETDRPVLRAALKALAWLGEKDEKFVLPLGRHLCEPSTCGPTAYLLMAIDTPAASDLLERALVESGRTALPNSDNWNVTGFLCRKPERRLRLLNYLWGKLSDRFDFWAVPESFAVFAELGGDEIEEFLWEEAFPRKNGIYFVGRRPTAIRGLAKLRPSEAFRAAEILLAEETPDQESLPELLADVDAAQAVPLLCRHAPNESKLLAKWNSGVALRFARDRGAVLEHLTSMLCSSDTKVQEAGAQLCGWQGPGFLTERLQNFAMESTDEGIRQAAIKSLARQKSELVARSLSERLRQATSMNKWRYVEALIECIHHPSILVHKSDVLGLLEIARSGPPLFLEHVEQLIRERHERLKREAEAEQREADKQH